MRRRCPERDIRACLNRLAQVSQDIPGCKVPPGQLDVHGGHVAELRVFVQPLEPEIIRADHTTVGSTARTKIDFFIRPDNGMVHLVVAAPCQVGQDLLGLSVGADAHQRIGIHYIQITFIPAGARHGSPFDPLLFR